jgi:Tol biopolymer transport system component
MTERSEISGVLRHWFDDGPSTMPDRVVDIVADRIARQPQRRVRPAVWRGGRRVPTALAVAAALALLVVVLVTVATIGGFPHVVTPRVSPVNEPNPSSSPTPAGGLIVVEVVDTNLENELRYIAPDLRALPLLPDFGGHQRTAAWRPDGQRLAFAGHPADQRDAWMHLYETQPDGTSVRPLSTDCELPACVEETDPAYSPDGTRLVAVRLADLRDDEPTRSALVIYDLVTGEATEIPNTSFPYISYDIGHPRWSPDGSQVVFHVVEGPPTKRRRLVFPEPTSPGPSSIQIIGTDGSGLRQVTPDGLFVGDPDWSPDGETILFGPTPFHLWLYGQDQTDWRIQAVGPDGSGLREMIPGPDVGAPSWTAGGRQFLFTETNGLDQAVRVAASDGSGVTDVARFHSRDVVIYPVQQPTRH